MEEVAGALERWLSQPQGSETTTSLKDPKGEAPKAKLTPSDSLKIMPSAIADDDLLTLAPEDDDPPARGGRRKKTKRVPQSSIISTDGSDTELEDSAEGAALEEEQPAESNRYGLSPLLDDLGDGDSFWETPMDVVSNVHSGASDVHASDALKSNPLQGTARDTGATGVLPTAPPGEKAAPQESKQSYFGELYEGFKRGEYPLWILIGAGVLLGGLLLFVAYSYFFSFTPPEVPDRLHE